jgi:hypothetical protein
MSPRHSARTQACSETDARTRLRHARKFIEVAELVAGEGEEIEYASQAAALAVLAGIAQTLNRLLSLKDEAQYGLFDVGGKDLKSSLRQANELVAFAEETLRG